MASQWIPQDDFILRKSIENGVSLESLAKGVVKFSRKFTISELKDRWYSLLYNPQVKSLSSSVGFELQYSARFLSQSQDHGHHNTTNVRSQYYKALKKRRLENHVASGSAPVAEEGANALECYDFLDGIDETDIDNFHKSFSDFVGFTTDNNVEDTNDEYYAQLVNHLLNDDDEKIPDCNGLDTTGIEHVLMQEAFQDPCPPEEYFHIAMSLSELDPHPEINKDGVIICTLNRESDEIPDNDDFNPLLYNRKARNSVVPSSRKDMRPPLPITRGSSSSQARGNSDMIQRYGFGDCGASTSTAFKDNFTENVPSSFTATTSASIQHSPENEIYGQALSNAEMDINVPMLEQEENNNEIESDEDLPSYSDVEAMILDMDLEPVGQDRCGCIARRYRNEEMARMIMRLEQSAESYMNRDIASHGAFAVLYGSAKHYISKPEVIIGRETGEYQIDIDLGKLESGTKVSRRQALITLKQDGSFEIKNLGKLSIWMNDKEIKQGEVVNLTNSCLIQIREITFIFEMNKTCVKRYLDGIRK